MKTKTMGSVEEYLMKKIGEEGAIHLTLIDPEKTNPETAGKISVEAEKAGTKAILLGGSTVASSNQVDLATQEIKKSVNIPLILFPGNVSGVSKFADAMFFMSLLNSSNPYFIVDAQALATPIIKQYGIETIPVGYVIMGSGGSAGFVGYARPIPYDKPELAVMYALTAQYFGMRFIYLEAGSGAKESIPQKTILTVRKEIDIPLIVGGGIKTREDSERIVKAGANVIVTGTITETTGLIKEKIGQVIEGIKKGLWAV